MTKTSASAMRRVGLGDLAQKVDAVAEAELVPEPLERGAARRRPR